MADRKLGVSSRMQLKLLKERDSHRHSPTKNKTQNSFNNI